MREDDEGVWTRRWWFAELQKEWVGPRDKKCWNSYHECRRWIRYGKGRMCRGWVGSFKLTRRRVVESKWKVWLETGLDHSETLTEDVSKGRKSRREEGDTPLVPMGIPVMWKTKCGAGDEQLLFEILEGYDIFDLVYFLGTSTKGSLQPVVRRPTLCTLTSGYSRVSIPLPLPRLWTGCQGM